MKVALYSGTVLGHGFTSDALEKLAPLLNRDDVKLEDIPFETVAIAVDRYIQETDTLVIESVYSY